MEKWEYLVLDHSGRNSRINGEQVDVDYWFGDDYPFFVHIILNKLGKEGWELVNTLSGVNYPQHFYFKRRIEE